MWMPAAKAGKDYRKDLRGPWGIMQEGGQWSFRDALLSALAGDGGDFQDAKFTCDTVLRIERRASLPNGKGYQVHVFERELSALKDCADLVDSNSYVGDFMQEED